MSGIPVYSVQGRGGGWRLPGGARTDLSGLTASEARALFLVAGPASTATPAVRSALRRLVGTSGSPALVRSHSNRLPPTYAHGCGGTCGRKAGFCRQRVLTRPETDDTKSRAGRRAVGLPSELVDLIRIHA
jgi:hypothetical protein